MYDDKAYYGLADMPGPKPTITMDIEEFDARMRDTKWNSFFDGLFIGLAVVGCAAAGFGYYFLG